jgi:hypothetical protein
MEGSTMNTRFLLTLLGATALIPTTAMAQRDPHQRAERIRRDIDGGQAPRSRAEIRADIEGRPRVEAPARIERPHVERPRAVEQRTEPQRDPGQNWRGQRPDRGQNWQVQPRPVQGDPNRDRDWQNRPNGDGGWRTPPRDAQGQIDRGQLRREYDRGKWRRNDPDRNRKDWNRNNGGWDRSDSDWRDHDRFRGDYDDRRQWNRDWRRDDRYDWNRYRQSNRNVYRLPRYYSPQGYGYGYRRFGIGVTLNSFLFGPNYWIRDPYTYRLPEVYGEYRWVRYYNDALLVDIDTGQVVDVEYNIFW